MKIPDKIMRQAVTGVIDRDLAQGYCQEQSLELADLWNTMALAIAHQFMADTMTFHGADTAMNAIYTAMLNDAMKTPFAEPAFSIFGAFDIGEYDHGDGCDPIAKYTRPEIERILKEA